MPNFLLPLGESADESMDRSVQYTDAPRGSISRPQRAWSPCDGCDGLPTGADHTAHTTPSVGLMSSLVSLRDVDFDEPCSCSLVNFSPPVVLVCFLLFSSLHLLSTQVCHSAFFSVSVIAFSV